MIWNGSFISFVWVYKRTISLLCILSNSFFDFPSRFAFKIASWPSFEFKYCSTIFSSFDWNKPALIVVLLLLRVLFLLSVDDDDEDDDDVRKKEEVIEEEL